MRSDERLVYVRNKRSRLQLELGLLERDTGDEDSWNRPSSALSVPGPTWEPPRLMHLKRLLVWIQKITSCVMPGIWDMAIHLEDIVVHGATMWIECLYKVSTALTGHDFTLKCMFALISSVCGVLPLYWGYNPTSLKHRCHRHVHEPMPQAQEISYQHFMTRYFETTVPLHRLLKTEEPLLWTSACPPILPHFDQRFDTCCELKEVLHNQRFLVVVYDLHSKWPEAIPAGTVVSKFPINILDSLFACFPRKPPQIMGHRWPPMNCILTWQRKESAHPHSLLWPPKPMGD